ncbi:DUF3896 family protein [Bacillus rubiinfantis]|uniref:DUF3896 family protein n=1 Tax=Bacillus rubiinfantis TaxID=1499680 RepID=UPI0005AAF4B0|nr:DUF3896 family protein [Bacillus rubiinfantis]
MQYEEVKELLEAEKVKLMEKINNPNLSAEEREKLQHNIVNVEYIIELTDMNHFERGFILQ